MRHALVLLLAALPGCAFAATETFEGRWEGAAKIPGRELRLIVDLAPDATGAWTGSIIVPGLGLKGAPLSTLAVSAADVSFDLGGALSSPTYGPARFNGHRAANGAIEGEMKQGGNATTFQLVRAGPAEVESPPRSTSVSPGVEGRWEGDFELGDYPRHVTITVENHAGAAASASFVVVGRQTTTLPVDRVTEESTNLRVESLAARVSFEGRIEPDRNEMRGTIDIGGLELPLKLQRTTRTAS